MVVASFSAVLLQIFFVPFIEISIWRPDLILLVVLYTGWRFGAVPGTLLGFFLGLVQDSMGIGPLGLSSLVNSIAGFGAGFLMPFRFQENTKILVSILLILLHSSIFFALYQFKTETTYFYLLITRVFPNTIYTFTVGLVVMFLFRTPLRRLG